LHYNRDFNSNDVVATINMVLSAAVLSLERTKMIGILKA
jgi:hypothetical protein